MQAAFGLVIAQGSSNGVGVVRIDTGQRRRIALQNQCLARHQHLDATQDRALAQRLPEEQVFGQALLIDHFVLLSHLA